MNITKAINSASPTCDSRIPVISGNNSWGIVDLYQYLNFHFHNDETNEFFSKWNKEQGKYVINKKVVDKMIPQAPEFMRKLKTLLSTRIESITEMKNKLTNIMLINSEELPTYQTELAKLESIISNNEFIEQVNELREREGVMRQECILFSAKKNPGG